MAARTPAEAVRGYVEPPRRAISCVTPSVLIGGGQRPQADPHALVLGDGTLARLQGPHSLGLAIAISYVLEEATGSRSGWVVRTTSYDYSLLRADERELLAYHWHPTGRSPIVWPHLHVSGPTAPIDLTRAHLPTSAIALPAVLRCAIGDLGVRPLRQDWPAVPAAAERGLGEAAG